MIDLNLNLKANFMSDTQINLIANDSISTQIELEKMKARTLELELQVLMLKNAPKPESQSPQLDFAKMTVAERESLLANPKNDLSRARMPANTYWNRTVWHVMPVIRNGKIEYTKVVPYVHKNQYVRADEVASIENLEREYKDLNERMRRKLEQDYFAENGVEGKPWMAEQRAVNATIIKPLEGVFS